MVTWHRDVATDYSAECCRGAGLGRNATVFYARDDFGGRNHRDTDETVRQRFQETLSRARPKLAHDYLERDLGSEQDLVSRLVVSQWDKERNAEASQPNPAHPATNELKAKQQAAAERWASRQQNAPEPLRDIKRDLGRDHSLSPENEHALSAAATAPKKT